MIAKWQVGLHDVKRAYRPLWYRALVRNTEHGEAFEFYTFRRFLAQLLARASDCLGVSMATVTQRALEQVGIPFHTVIPFYRTAIRHTLHRTIPRHPSHSYPTPLHHDTLTNLT